MNRIALATLLGSAAVGITLLGAPAAQASSDLGSDAHFCDALHGTFTTAIMGGQTKSTCTFEVLGNTHHLYYTNARLISKD
jgi:hypothetical protein